MDAVAAGKAGLQGWRAKVGDAVAGPVARRSGLSDDQVRAAVVHVVEETIADAASHRWEAR